MVKMSKEILDVVNAVLTYKRFICSHNHLCPKENFDWYYETKKILSFFNSTRRDEEK